MVGTTVTSKIRMQRFRNLLPQIKFIQIYFSTETGLIAANSHDKYMESCHKPEAIGPLLSSSKVKIIDIESGKLLGPNKYGQLLFNGDGLMLGFVLKFAFLIFFYRIMIFFIVISGIKN